MNLDNAPTFVDAASAPAAANAAIASALADEMEKPVMPSAVDDEVTLPCGIDVGGTIATRAVVRELTGADEEAIARATNSPTPERVLTVLLRAGVVSIGGVAPTEAMLDDLLVGDRDALVLGIRRVTYGNEIEYERYTCPHCGGSFSLTLTLDDIPVVTSDEPGKREITVPLRKPGWGVRVRLMTGGDQVALLKAEAAGKTVAEQDTLLLSRTVIAILAHGGEVLVAGNVARVRDQMNMRDRGTILRALRDNRPGPRMDEVTVTCADCGQEHQVTVTVDALFRS